MKKMMSKLLCVLLVLCMVLPMVPTNVFAATIVKSGTCGENLTWTLDSDGLLTISGSGEMLNSNSFQIAPWRAYAVDIKQVIIHSGVSQIGDSAFYLCKNLDSITIPDSVTSIGDSAFYLCTNLDSITIPDSVTSIGDSAFADCMRLTSITIPESVTSIGAYAFYECTSLTSITIPDSVTSIANHTFFRCNDLTSITIPDSVTSIGAYAFYECTSLNSITIPDSVTSIGEGSFNQCTGLTSITIPDGVTSIGAHTFVCCESLSSITIPESVASIGDSAFHYCDSLTDVYYSGSKGQWESIELDARRNEHLINANIHFNSSGPSNTEGNGRIRLFTSWDPVMQIAYFGQFDVLGYKVTEKTDTSFLANVENLIGKYVWVESEPVGNGIVDSDILLCIKEVETRTGTVSQADASTITIDGVSYSTPHDIDLPGIFAGEQVRYYLSNGELLGLELLDGTIPENPGNDNPSGDSGNNTPTNPTDKPSVGSENPYNSLQMEWIEQHMDYANSNNFKNEIVNGFNGELLNILRIALEDDDIHSYNLQNRFLQVLQLDFEITNEEVYELILAELFYGQTESFAEACFAENLEKTIWENTQIVYDVISTADNISDVDPNELRKIDALYTELCGLKFGTAGFSSTFAEFCGIIQNNFKLSDIMSNVLSEGKFILMDSAITLALEKYEAFEDIMWYAAYYEASQNMAEQTEEVLVRLVYNVYIMGDSFYVPDGILSQLGLGQSISNWASLQAATKSFLASLSEFKNNPNAIADYAVRRHKEANNLVLDKTIDSVANFAIDSALMCVPVVNKIVTLKKATEAAITANIILTRLFTNIDDKANNLELMVAHYVLSTVLYDVVLDCKDSMQSTDFFSTTVFDKAVSIYKRNTALAITYAENYATLVLAEKIHELNEHDKKSFWPQQIDLTRKKLVQAVESFNKSITALKLQLLGIENTLCHDKSMFYDYINDVLVYNPNNGNIYVIACPVEVIVLNEAGEVVARLNGTSNQIAKGYEKMFETALIPSGDNDYIKVAIVPDGYSVHIEGVGEGSMNAFVTRADGADLGEVNAYFDIPVHNGSSGRFQVSLEKTPTIVVDDKAYHDMAQEDNVPAVIGVIICIIICVTVLVTGAALFVVIRKRTKTDTYVVTN